MLSLNLLTFGRSRTSIINDSFDCSFLFLLVLLSVFPLQPSFSQGNLLVNPRRVVFEGNRRSFDLNLANIGQDTATYAISFVQIKMNEDGVFEVVSDPEPGQKFADQNLRFFPRQITLAPNEAQVVKLQLLRANQLSPGEYRSHLYFRAIPKAVALGEKDKPAETETISVQIKPIVGITIPAIIRVGQISAAVTLTDLSININTEGIPEFRLRFNRTGEASIYGDLAVDHISPSGTVTRVGIANGIAVYTPNKTRYFRLYLAGDAGVDYKSGRLRVTFSAPSDVKPAKYAEAELILR